MSDHGELCGIDRNLVVSKVKLPLPLLPVSRLLLVAAVIHYFY